jgi:CheY-like chemotaxis protein
MAARSLPTTGPRRLRLLCVAHEPENLALVEQFVAARKDLVLTRAADVDLALRVARRERAEVMLIDIDLAEIGAVELMKILRANPATQATPVIALSADTAPEAAVRTLEAGFFHYLVKPLQTGPLTEALDYALEFAALERAEL